MHAFGRQGEILSLEVTGRGEVTARDAAIAQAQGKKLSGLETVAVNGRPVPLSRPLHHGDRVDVIQGTRARVLDTPGSSNTVARTKSPPWTSLKEVRMKVLWLADVGSMGPTESLKDGNADG